MAYVLNSMGLSRRQRLVGYDALATGTVGHDNDCMHCMQPCECPTGCYPVYRRNVVYTGPCPPSPDDPCQPPLPPPPPDPPFYQPYPDSLAYGYFAQTDSLTVSQSDGRLPVDTLRHASPDAFRIAGDTITIMRPGTYEAALSLNIPARSSVHTTLGMTLGGETLSGSTVHIDSSEGSSDHAHAETVFQVLRPGQVFRVASSNPFTLTGEPAEALSVLTIRQLMV